MEQQFGIDFPARPTQHIIDMANARLDEHLAQRGLKEVRRYEHEHIADGKNVFSIEVFAVDG